MESVPVIQPVIIFYAYSVLGNNLTYAKAFTSLSLFYMLTGPISQLPGFFQHYFNATVACERILKVLNSEDREDYVTTIENETFAIVVENASFGWVLKGKVENVEDVSSTTVDKDGKEKGYEMVQLTEVEPSVDDKTNRGLYTLQNLNFSVEKGLLVAVIGSVGTGKSSLIQAMLGEMYKTGGSINLHGKIAFHSQQPWVMNRTLRDNITLGKKLDEKRLNEVLAAVALDVDIRTLSAGLDTEIGEKVRSSSLSLSCYYHHYHHYYHHYHHH
jgi:ABC-type multidrug transport system fused ATPase/permease subunit